MLPPFNPAGIVLLEKGESQLGAHLVVPSATFHNEGSGYVAPGTPFDGLAISGNNGGDAGVAKDLPNVYLTQPLMRNPH